MFVTWEIKRMLGYELRGCIGCLSSLKLGQMERYAKLAYLYSLLKQLYMY